jgi:radical SAM protein with 4Fe4S-binding SPASM domain
MLRIADQIIELSPQSLTISGGEPMILPHFFELSEYIKKRCEGLLYLITNGTLITEQNAENIAKLFDNVSISIDGVDEETCSKIRGKGVFSKVISGIKYLKNAGLDKISLSMVLTNDNKKYEQKFYDMCDELKVQAYVRVFAPIGRGKEHADLYISSDKEIVKDKVLPNVVLEKKKNNQPKNEIGVCSAEYGSITISAEGNMFLCAPFQFMGQSLGKVADVENLKEYIKLEKYKNTVAYKEFEKLLPENKENCKECNVRYFCWHCSFINEQALKNDEYYLSDCKGKKRDLKFSVWGEQV